MIYTYWKWDKAIPKEYCDLIIKKANWKETKSAKILSSKPIDENIRKTKVVWENSFSVIGSIADRYTRAANIAAGWNYDLHKNIGEIQIGKYDSGGFYDWHRDGEIIDENPRKLSFVMLLNDPKEFKGGLFEFKHMKEQPKLEQGSIMVFISSATHRVTPVTSGERYSAVSWMCGPNFK